MAFGSGLTPTEALICTVIAIGISIFIVKKVLEKMDEQK